MSSEQEEVRKKQLSRLLAANKTKRERIQLLHIYQQVLGLTLSPDQFLDLASSHRLKKEIYQHIWQRPAQKIAAWPDVLAELARLRENRRAYDDKWVMFYYWDTAATGGIRMLFKQAWAILESIKEELRSDILIVDAQLTFGITLEVEEQGYSLVYWGLKADPYQTKRES